MTILFDIDGMKEVMAAFDLHTHQHAMNRFMADVQAARAIPTVCPSDIDGSLQGACYERLSAIARIEEGAHVE